MIDEPVDVIARWESNSLRPRQFTWHGRWLQVESTGRQWEDEAGLHILCMVRQGAVFELIFHLNPAGWSVRPPVSAPVV